MAAMACRRLLTSAASEPLVTLTERPHGVAVLTLTHPAALNAMSPRMGEAFRARVRQLAARPDLRAVVVTGQGKAFSAGGDLAFLRERTQVHKRETGVGGQ
jgi:enoyl-CoA hydratase